MNQPTHTLLCTSAFLSRVVSLVHCICSREIHVDLCFRSITDPTGPDRHGHHPGQGDRPSAPGVTHGARVSPEEHAIVAAEVSGVGNLRGYTP